ncbi:hypothetical protein X801_07463, partial [Opisthorchis viverrini]
MARQSQPHPKIRLRLLHLYSLASTLLLLCTTNAEEARSSYRSTIDDIPVYESISMELPDVNISYALTDDPTTTSAISLAIVFDSTGSMGNDLKQVKIGARRILQRHMQRGEANYIKDFVLVKVHDPDLYLVHLSIQCNHGEEQFRAV